MVTRLSVRGSAPLAAGGWNGGWFPAADLELDDGRTATLWYDRGGRARLSLVLDRPAGATDVDALEAAADVLPHLEVWDLPAGAGLRQRHAEALGLAAPLPLAAFGATAEVELVARPGGVPLPSSLGRFGIPGRTVLNPPPAPRPRRAANDRLPERALLALGRAVVALLRTPAHALCAVVLGAVVSAFVAAFTWQTWALHARFGTYGFDLGIFDQGTWLLSRARDPFVTIRGLNLFGDHASLVLLLVAPLYRVWADPRLLLTIQVLALAAPALVAYRIGWRYLGHPAAGLAIAVAYLAYPGMQWAITWQFHPETIAAGALALAAWAAERKRWRAMAGWLALALSCKEDIGLVVAGFGLVLVLAGERRVGWRTVAAGASWFVVATFVFVPLVNGHSSPHFALNYAITGSGPRAVLLALPHLLWVAVVFALSNKGLSYLALVLLPLVGLPLLAPRRLLPVAAPLFLNLAAWQPTQHEIRYQYLATSAPFLAIAAAAGLALLAARRRALLAPLLVVLVLAAGWFDHQDGPALWSRNKVVAGPGPIDQVRRHALALIDPTSPVSAQYNLVTHLDHRDRAYEFPNPFKEVNWGLGSDHHTPQEVASLRWVIVERGLLGTDERKLLDQLQASPQWRTAFDSDGILVLERAGGAGP